MSASIAMVNWVLTKAKGVNLRARLAARVLGRPYDRDPLVTCDIAE